MCNNELILFTPVGMSDPIRGNYDGPFLHILRYKKPEKAYVFLTKETLAFHLEDNRYERLGKKVCPDCQFVFMDYSYIDNPSDYLIIDKALKEAFNKVYEENNHSEIIVNITSGTTQMNSSLYVLAASSRVKIKLISVFTHEKASNKSNPVGNDFDIDCEWDNDFDNITGDSHIVSRCKEILPENVRYQIAVESIISHINVYDYKAALLVADNSKGLFSHEIRFLLQAMSKRINLFYDEAYELSKKAGYRFSTLNTQGERELFEYLLYLQTLIKRKEISEFARAVSPILTELILSFIKNEYAVDFIEMCCYYDEKNDLFKIKREKLGKICPIEVYDKEFKPSFNDNKDLSFSSLIPFVKHYNNIKNDNPVDLGKILELRDFEINVRNRTAHQIIGISDPMLKKRFGYHTVQILNNIKYLFNRAFPRYERNAPWDSYDSFNSYLIELL